VLLDTISAYREALLDTDRTRALKCVDDAVSAGTSPEDVVFRVVIPTIETMMDSVCQGTSISLAQHFMTAQISAEVVDSMIPRFRQRPGLAGQMVIGTSHGDFHGLGKTIVAGVLKAQMIGVIDLGLSVSAERFVDKAVEVGAEVIGISSMMVHTARGERGCLKVRALLRERGLEDRIKVVVGGAPYRFDHGLAQVVGADAWAEDAAAAAPVVRRLLQEAHGR
jgi:methanogenic corrinoid protein MtbC1